MPEKGWYAIKKKQPTNQNKSKTIRTGWKQLTNTNDKSKEKKNTDRIR